VSREINKTESALRWIGDLDHPYYKDERSRFVWYESSAIGFQLIIILQYLTAGIALIIGGRAAVPYVAPFMVSIVFVIMIVQRYSQSKNAMYWPTGSDFKRKRGLLQLLMGTVFLIGALRVSFQEEIFGEETFEFSTIAGFIVGLVAVLSGFFVGMKISKSRQKNKEEELEID